MLRNEEDGKGEDNQVFDDLFDVLDRPTPNTHAIHVSSEITKGPAGEAPSDTASAAAAGPPKDAENASSPAETKPNTILTNYILPYFRKWLGHPGGRPPPFPSKYLLVIGTLASFVFILILIAIRYGPGNPNAGYTDADITVIITSYGATAILLYGAPESPLAQPRNAFFGQLIAFVCSMICRDYIANPMGNPIFAFPFAVALTLFFMLITSTVHPPAGGTVGFVVFASAQVDGWELIVPCIVSSVVSIVVCVVFSNMNPKIKGYPTYWFVEKPERICQTCKSAHP